MQGHADGGGPLGYAPPPPCRDSRLYIKNTWAGEKSANDGYFPFIVNRRGLEKADFSLEKVLKKQGIFKFKNCGSPALGFH